MKTMDDKVTFNWGSGVGELGAREVWGWSGETSFTHKFLCSVSLPCE